MALFLSSRPQQLSRFSVAWRWRVTTVKASKKNNSDSCQMPISIIGYFSDMSHLTTLLPLYQILEAFTRRPWLSGKHYFSTDLNWNLLTLYWGLILSLITWHWFCLLSTVSDHTRLLPWWPRGVDNGKTWDCCWIQSNTERTLQELLWLSFEFTNDRSAKRDKHRMDTQVNFEIASAGIYTALCHKEVIEVRLNLLKLL